MTNLPIRKRIEAGVAYIPEDRQNTGLVLGFSLEDNLALKRYYQAVFSNKTIMNKKAFEKTANAL